jgi:hypothetical protein
MPSFTPDAKVTVTAAGLPGLLPFDPAADPMAAVTRLS